ncbi:MerR family transcriptional regulator [Actinomadura sp. HBU206391]|uniref:MerR family transcriptional regulator n=1 Tax=Actinomadura sp. HBU206391 TaxID=2731692 RepID=UPI001650BCA5|nr:MerR family transcriptional regulator [Actinomadura sp. HBU206391]MBC6462667.1 MerR family transcriptional regulator [Actinomadura sp. HBU206391]
MSELSISELQARTGLASSALRFYERKGLLRATKRAGGKRIYDEDAVEQVALIDLLKQAGFTLSEIAALVGPSGRTAPNWRAVASAKLRELDDRVQQIQQAQKALRHALDCRHDHLDDCPVHHRILRAHAEALAAAANNTSPTAHHPGSAQAGRRAAAT